MLDPRTAYVYCPRRYHGIMHVTDETAGTTRSLTYACDSCDLIVNIIEPVITEPAPDTRCPHAYVHPVFCPTCSREETIETAAARARVTKLRAAREAAERRARYGNARTDLRQTAVHRCSPNCGPVCTRGDW